MHRVRPRHRPDTKANRAGFRRHIGFAPPATVSGIYYYADDMGADETFQLGFTSDPETIARIVTEMGLTGEESEREIGVAREFPWWRAADIEDLVPYCRANEAGDGFRYLWYNGEDRRAYYLEFSL